MNLNNIKQLVTSNVGRSVLQVRKTSPQILTAVGVVGFVATTVMAAKATLKLEEKVTAMEEGILEAKTAEVDETERKRLLTKAYLKGSGSIVKLYTPAALTGVASVGCLLGAQGIMQKRNVALAAAYKAVEESFTNYRARVVEELGEEKERELSGPRVKQVELKSEDGETKVLNVVDEGDTSMYARWFDSNSPVWEPNAEYNATFLVCQQSVANQKLRAQGHLFLNEVYDALGLERSPEGQIVGWIYDREHQDTFVDFGIDNGDREMVRQIADGYEPTVLVDFNVMGNVFDKI